MAKRPTPAKAAAPEPAAPKTPPLTKNLTAGGAVFAVHVLPADVIMVDDSVFSALPPARKAEAFVKLQQAPQAVVRWEKDFADYRDLRGIRARLLRGEDVTEHLLFNGVVLGPEYLQAQQQFRARQQEVLGVLAQLIPPYAFAAPARRVETPMTFTDAHVTRNGYRLLVPEARKIWVNAEPFWRGGQQPGEFYVLTDGRGNQQVVVKPTQVALGCQRIPRWQVEQAAVHYGWVEPEGAPAYPR